MGSSRNWNRVSSKNPVVRFEWEPVTTILGVKVLQHTKQPNKALPTFSNTPNTMYFRIDTNGHISELRIFKGRNSYMDIDWGHNHKEKGFYVPAGTAHVQYWKFNTFTNKMDRDNSKQTHLMSKYLIKKYGNKIKKADPNVKWE
ncbi:MAG: hypothetical protein MJY74_00135 [Bacteroidaceae bacterium]|nr:hypothetical protein [Bacteroidaceae bacterium]